MFHTCNPMEWGPIRLLHPWDSPGKNTGMGCHLLLQGIFPAQGSKPGLLHCSQSLYLLSYKGSPLYLLFCSIFSFLIPSSLFFPQTFFHFVLYISFFSVSFEKYKHCSLKFSVAVFSVNCGFQTVVSCWWPLLTLSQRDMHFLTN